MGKYFTEKERYQLESLLKAGLTQKAIAQELKKSLSTTKREIKRGIVTLISSELMEYDHYCADFAQRRYDALKKNKGIKSKLPDDSELVQFLQEKIVDKKCSPYAALTDLEKEDRQFSVKFCLKTLYNAIDAGILKGISNKNLPRKKDQKPKEKKEPTYKKRLNPDRTSIDQRPEVINDRLEMNHWEMDCVLSGQTTGKAALVVMTERASRLTYIRKLKAKTNDEIIRVLDTLENTFKDQFKTIFRSITMDNGSEFLNDKAIEKSIFGEEKRTTTYYCHA
ncbi:MAG: IS30 family transposase, partial [Eubacterium sp.]